MTPIRKNSNEYAFAKSKAVNVLFFSSYNSGTYEMGEVSHEAWTETSTLFRDGTCYVLKHTSGSYYRWSS